MSSFILPIHPFQISLFQKGVDLTTLNSFNRSALHNAVIGGQLSIAQFLLQDPRMVEMINAPDVDGNTCVHLAALHGNLEMMALFIEHGADFEKPNKNGGLYPVHLAAQRGHWDLIKLLHRHHIRLDQKCVDNEKTAIHYAAEVGADEVVKGLVTMNAVDVADIDANGNLATHSAAMGNKLSVLKYLTEQGIRVDQISNYLGRYPIHYAAASNGVTVLHWILDNTIPEHANLQDHEGNTPAHMAGLYGAAVAFNCLKAHGCNLDIVNNKNETPKDVARRCGHPFLIEKACELFFFYFCFAFCYFSCSLPSEKRNRMSRM